MVSETHPNLKPLMKSIVINNHTLTKTQKRSKISSLQGRMRQFLVILSAIFWREIQSNPLYKITTDYVLNPKTLDCSVATTTHLFAFRTVAHGGTPVSFQLTSDTAPANLQYITDTDGNKKFAALTPGSNCYFHPDNAGKNAYSIVILVIQSNGNPTDSCQVVKIITSRGFQACGGATTKDLYSVIQLNSGSGTPAAFSSVGRNDLNFLLNAYLAMSFTLENFAVSDIDERVIEMVLVQALHVADRNAPVNLLDSSSIKLANQHLALNSFATEIKPEGVMKRVVHDDLPGYYLGVYSGPGDDTSKYVQKVFLVNTFQTHGLQIELYITKPALLVVGQKHTIEFTSKYWRTSAGQSITGRLKDFNYKIEVTRTATHLEFRVKRDASNLPALNLDLSYSGSTNYVYFTFTVGGAVLYYLDALNTDSKFYETLHVYQVGQPVLVAQSSFRETVSVHTVQDDYGFRWNKIEFKPPASITENTAGFRVMLLGITRGVYPPGLISNNDNQFSRCYKKGYGANICLSMGYLSGPGETQAPSYILLGRLASAPSAQSIGDSCRLASNYENCLWPKPGFVMNIETSLKSPLVYTEKNGPKAFGLIPETEYEALDSKVKDFYYKFQSNTGRVYLAGCPHSCNLNFS